MKKIIAFAFFAILILSACCKALPPSIKLKIVDDNSTNLLINASTSDSTWTWDPQNSKTPDQLKIVSYAEAKVLEITSSGLTSGQDYLIQVEPGDLDTISVIYDLKGFNCNINMRVESISYNGVLFPYSRNESDFTVIK